MAGQRAGEAQSQRFQLDAADWRKLGSGLLVALVGAAATFLADVSTSLNFGMWSPFIAMGLSVVVNALRKWLSDNSPTPPASVRLYEAEQERPRSGIATETVILALTALTLGLLALAALRGGLGDRSTPQREAVVSPVSESDAVTRAFVLQRQLFARVCLEAAKRERAGSIASEDAENAWCEPRWAAARTEAFGLLADARDRQLADGWSAHSSAAGLEAWARAADPKLTVEAGEQ